MFWFEIAKMNCSLSESKHISSLRIPFTTHGESGNINLTGRLAVPRSARLSCVFFKLCCAINKLSSALLS